MVRTGGGTLLREDVVPILQSLMDIHRNRYVCQASLSMLYITLVVAHSVVVLIR